MRKLLVVLPLLGLIVLASCSKEKRLKNRIADEKWNISKVSGTISTTFFGMPLSLPVNQANAGSIELKENGSGTIIAVDSTGSENITVTSWSNTADKITINHNSPQSFPNPLIFTVKTNEKSKQVWNNTQSLTEIDNGDTTIINFNLDYELTK